MKQYKVVIRPEHCKDASFLNPFDCPLARAIKEQLPDFSLYGVGGYSIRDRNDKDWPFNHEDWNHLIMENLKKSGKGEVEIFF